MLTKMAELWTQFRNRASRKEERSHFGLAWSVFAGYWLAGAVLLRSLREQGWLMTLADFGVALFFIVGAFGVYLAFAVPMRWWPHQPQKRNEEQLEEMEALFLEGLNLIDDWGRAVKSLDDPILGLMPDKSEVARDLAMRGGQNMVAWIPQSEQRVSKCLGSELGSRYKMSPDLDREEPQWAEKTMWVGLHRNVMCRLSWLRAWSQDQFDL